MADKENRSWLIGTVFIVAVGTMFGITAVGMLGGWG